MNLIQLKCGNNKRKDQYDFFWRKFREYFLLKLFLLQIV